MLKTVWAGSSALRYIAGNVVGCTAGKKTAVNLALLTDVDIHLFIERGTWGGISMVSKRYPKANNLYVKDCNPSEPTIFTFLR